MFDAKRIEKLFHLLNDKMKERGEVAEVGIVGGAVMCLVYNARHATKDIDAIFEPASVVRKAVKAIAEEEQIPPDWLNDAAKGYLTANFQRQEVLSLANLKVWAPEARYMLAMKCLSARWDSADKGDVKFLVKYLNIATAEAVFKIIENYYPKKQIPPKTQFFIEELISK